MPEKDDDKKKDGKDDRKSKQKEVISKLAEAESKKAAEASSAQSELHKGGHSKISFHLSFELDRGVKAKLPFLLAVMLFATFAFIMFAKTGFSFTDVFDFQRISHNFEKILSISFFLFLLLFCLSLAFATFFGFNLKTSTAFVSMLIIIIPILIAYLLSPPNFLLAYIALAFAIVLSALFASILEDLSFNSIFKSMGRTLLVLAVLAALFTLVKVNSQKDEYFDLFISNIATLSTQSPEIEGQVKESLAKNIQSLELKPDSVPISGNPSKYITRNSLQALVKLQYPSFRDINIKSFKKADQAYAEEQMPKAYDSLDASSKDKLVDDTFAYLKDDSTDGITSGAFIKAWPDIRGSMVADVKAASVSAPTSAQLKEIRALLDENKFVKQFYNIFEFAIAILVYTVLSFINFVARALSAALCFGLTKL